MHPLTPILHPQIYACSCSHPYLNWVTKEVYSNSTDQKPAFISCLNISTPALSIHDLHYGYHSHPRGYYLLSNEKNHEAFYRLPSLSQEESISTTILRSHPAINILLSDHNNYDVNPFNSRAR